MIIHIDISYIVCSKYVKKDNRQEKKQLLNCSFFIMLFFNEKKIVKTNVRNRTWYSCVCAKQYLLWLIIARLKKLLNNKVDLYQNISKQSVISFIIFQFCDLEQGCSKPNQYNRKTVNRTNPNRNRKKPHLVRMYSDHFLAQLHDLVWFAVFILPTEPNQTKPQHKKNVN